MIYDPISLGIFSIILCYGRESFVSISYLSNGFIFSPVESHVAEGFATFVESQQEFSDKLIFDALMIVLHYA